ncbi:hypothetical protein Agub_g10869, partial [Astrephomene gubernaculifera]
MAEDQLDVRIPTRRRRASDDEAEEAEFHDAAEYAASIADSHGQEEEHGDAESAAEGRASEENAEVVGDQEVGETDDQPDDEDKGDKKKAKLREPFEVPTSGAFWLHDDRFGEELQAEPARPGNLADRKARSDTEGRWLHDKFSTLELGEDAADNDSDNAFSSFRRGGSGRGRGGRRGGDRAPYAASNRGRGRGGGFDGRDVAASAAGAIPSMEDAPEALPQRPARPRRAPAAAAAASSDDDRGAAAAPAAPFSSAAAAGRGRGRGAGRGRGERALSPEGDGGRGSADRAFPGTVSGLEATGGGRGYGRGRGGGRDAGGGRGE